MGARNKKELRPTILAVEGRDYLYTLLKLLPRHGISFDDVMIHDYKDNGSSLETYLAGLRLASGFQQTVRCVGVLGDSEQERTATLRDYQRTLTNGGFASPSTEEAVEAGTPNVAVLLVPNGQANGCLEHACLNAIADPSRIACAQEFIKCVRTSPRNENYRAKHLVHALIGASSDEPAATLGESMDKHLWNIDHDEFTRITRWIESLRNAI